MLRKASYRLKMDKQKPIESLLGVLNTPAVPLITS